MYVFNICVFALSPAPLLSTSALFQNTHHTHHFLSLNIILVWSSYHFQSIKMSKRYVKSTDRIHISLNALYYTNISIQVFRCTLPTGSLAAYHDQLKMELASPPSFRQMSHRHLLDQSWHRHHYKDHHQDHHHHHPGLILSAMFSVTRRVTDC